MTVRKKKKSRKQRGKTTHGWGSMKKHRGKGNKGGSGKAGLGKRGAHKLPSYRNRNFKLGQRGFNRPGKKVETKTINLEEIKAQLNTLLKKEKIKKEKDTFVINLTDLGYDKLLGSGQIDKKLKIFVDSASKKAKQKIKSAGGKIIFPKKEDKKGEKPEVEEDEE